MEGQKKSRISLFEENPIGLGCWALGGKGWGGQSEKDSMAVLEAAFESGIRHLDTAQIYGVSESLVGRFIEKQRDDFFIASKVYPRGGPEKVREILERSLEHLRTDFIDLYYLHWPIEGLDIQKQMEVMAAAKEEGLIGAIGVSNYSVEQLRQAAEVAPVEFHQVGYHLLWRMVESEILPYCREEGIRVVSYSSLGQGILTGKFPERPSFPKGDHRRDHVIHFMPEIWPKVYQAVEELKDLAESAGRPLAQLAIRWVAAQQGVQSVLVGARNPKQVIENAAAMAGAVDSTVLSEMTRISDLLSSSLPRKAHIFDTNS